MGLLGIGEAHGACSVLHAGALGIGASMALDLPMTVRLRDNPPKRFPKDLDNVLADVVDVWEEAQLPLPDDREELYFGVQSDIPMGQGFKSSAALAVAALRALEDSVDGHMDVADLVDMAAIAQNRAKVALTGSKDDAWACAEGGWKVIDPQKMGREAILREGFGPSEDEYLAFCVSRPDAERQGPQDVSIFDHHRPAFEKSLKALDGGEALVALTWNGRAVAGALNDHEGRRIANEAMVRGARAAGLSGWGPGLVIFMGPSNQPALDSVWQLWESRGYEVVETKVFNGLPPEDAGEAEAPKRRAISRWH